MKKHKLQIAFDLDSLFMTNEEVRNFIKPIPKPQNEIAKVVDIKEIETKVVSTKKINTIEEEKEDFLVKDLVSKEIEYNEDEGNLNLRNLYNKDISRVDSRLLTANEEKEYFERIHNGDTKAREEFAKLNLKLVLSVAKKYSSYSDNFTELDIIQEGNIGLLTAISKYEPDKGTKFSTYAVWWINQAIKRALEDKTRTVRVPNHRVQKINKINKFITNYKAEFNEEPTVEVIAEKLGESVAVVKKTMLYNNGIISLNTNFTEEKDTELGDIISNGFNLEDEVVKKDQLSSLSNCIKLLSKEEKEIIGLRFYKNYKISQIERLLGIPRTKINKILEDGLKKMRTELNVNVSIS